jgi:uncharacterized protein involved in exopolysaccharide biosynthesis
LQVIDKAQVPERKSKPKRSILMIAAFGVGLLGLCIQTGWRLSSRRRVSV